MGRRVIGVLVSGAGSNLQALLEAGLPVAAVASGRADAGALERAGAAGVPHAVFPLERYVARGARDRALADWLDAHGVGLIVCAGFMEILTPRLLDRFPGRVVNVHPALLPAFPGAHAVEEALAAGVEETGVSVHLVDEGIDTGEVLVQERVPVLPGDTVDTLHARLREVEHRVLPRVVRELLAA